MSVLEKLLADRTTLVIGSAVMAFEEVFPAVRHSLMLLAILA